MAPVKPFKDVPDLKLYLKRLIYIIIGGGISAVALNTFIIPHQFLAGGLSGIALIVNYLWGVSPSMVLILLNIPIFFMGFFYIDLHFALASLAGLLSYTFFLEITQGLQGLLFIPDDILAAVFGGAINGIGMGITLRSRASFGGTDIIAAIAKRKWSVNMGTSLFFFNLIIIISSGFFFEMYKGLYSLVGLFIGSAVIDRMMEGFERRFAVFVVSKKWQTISYFITKTLGRGATLMNGEGAYLRQQTKVIYTVIPSRRLAKIKDGIYNIDPKAFMTVTPATEIMGHWNTGFFKGYKRIYEKKE